MAQNRTRMFAAGLASAALAGGLAVTALPQADAAPHAASPNALSAQDLTYLHDSAQGDLFEARGGRLALHKGDRRSVRSFGRLMVRDHTQSYRDTENLATEFGVTVPTSPSGGQRKDLRLWRSMDSRGFTCAYVTYEWEDHQLDIAQAKDEIENGKNPKVVDAARAELPTLELHLSRISRILAHMRGC